MKNKCKILWAIFMATFLVSASSFSADTNSTSMFSSNELRLDLFGSYSGLQDGGAGIGVSYFLTKNIGATIYSTKVNFENQGTFVEDANVGLIYRVPVTDVLAPYATIGAKWANVTKSYYTPAVDWDMYAGVGAEYRITKKFGVFTEAVCEFPDWNTIGKNGVTIRGGFKVGF